MITGLCDKVDQLTHLKAKTYVYKVDQNALAVPWY